MPRARQVRWLRLPPGKQGKPDGSNQGHEVDRSAPFCSNQDDSAACSIALV